MGRGAVGARVAGARRGPRLLRRPRLGLRPVGPAAPARPPPARRRDRRRRRPPRLARAAGGATHAGRPAGPRPRRVLRAGHGLGDERRHEPARDGRRGGLCAHAARRPHRDPSTPVLGRRRRRWLGAAPLDPNPGLAPRAARRVGPRRRAGRTAAAAGRRGHAVRIGGRSAVRHLAGLGARRPHRACGLAAAHPHRPRRRRRPAHRPVRLPVGVAGDRRHGPRGRRAVAVAPPPGPALAAAAHAGRRALRDRHPRRGGHRRRGRPAAAPGRHLAPVPGKPVARYAHGLGHRSGARHRSRVHADRPAGGGAGLQLPGAPAAFPQPAARRPRRRRDPRPAGRHRPHRHPRLGGRSVADPDPGRSAGRVRPARHRHRQPVRGRHVRAELQPPRHRARRPGADRCRPRALDPASGTPRAAPRARVGWPGGGRRPGGRDGDLGRRRGRLPGGDRRGAERRLGPGDRVVRAVRGDRPVASGRPEGARRCGRHRRRPRARPRGGAQGDRPEPRRRGLVDEPRAAVRGGR